ncbi:hypothetical protein [Streptomyces sp. ALI-76-A]|uniref:hypothetical protein n=1 Tax=Streptomyces sp. ALI-76-A TaxID=3025736 RepID=UPI00256ECB98|nr:hypothetical protein [Streptomyces sp. ALI-76-A]MDL5205717.1 hypothetical protein [Streptomyces sp. ALI-76-A]
MRAIPTVVTAGVACLVAGAAVTGCTDDTSGDELSAQRMLDRANGTMNDLKFSAFDKPLDVRAPAAADVLDASGVGGGRPMADDRWR